MSLHGSLQGADLIIERAGEALESTWWGITKKIREESQTREPVSKKLNWVQIRDSEDRV